MLEQFEIKKISITDLETDCIVNAANSALQQGSGVCGAVFEAAGARKLQTACNAYGYCPTGSAVLTPGFDCKAKYIVHAVGPQWVDGQHGEAKALRSCYQQALRLAEEKECRSIAFPVISAGIYGYPREQAWSIAVNTVCDYCRSHPQMHVIFAVLDDEMLALGQAAYQKYLSSKMPPHLNVSDMTANRSVSGFYVLQGAAARTTAAGKQFLSANISDRSGMMPVIFWDYAGPIGTTDDGKAVAIRGRITEFKGSLQITLEDLRLAGEGDLVDLSALVPVAPIDTKILYRQVLALVDSLTDKDYQAVCLEFLKRHGEQFLAIPAAKSVHHSFLHGLLMHTGYMLKAADFLAGLYEEVVDRNLLLAGTLLHDFAKREEFTFSSLGLVTDYSVKGQLLGHLVMGAQEVAEIGTLLQIPEEKSVLLQHMLLSHHGKPEFGAAVVPVCAESELLSMIDMMDSRMEIYRENLEQIPTGTFSGRVFALDGHRVYRHRELPAEE